jgi:molybdate transport system substrate-binding protein
MIFAMLSKTSRVSTILLLNFSALLSSVAGETKSEILVAAAADLQPLEADLARAFVSTTGASVRFTFGSSGNLAQQIEHGAPYDVYLSANEGFVTRLADSGHLLKDSVQVYAQGRIALWSKGGHIRSLPELAQPAVRHISIANPVHAPYGVAARDALKNKGLWEKLVPKIVYGENVQQAFQYAETGNADAAIIAWSLVANKGGILLPAAWHAPIRQTGGVVASSKNVPLARRFLELLAGAQGGAVLTRFGFDPPSR